MKSTCSEYDWDTIVGGFVKSILMLVIRSLDPELRQSSFNGLRINIRAPSGNTTLPHTQAHIHTEGAGGDG